ncbi:hypothetical protein C4544_03055 [candidate division WS5 bacterium]|uniref:Glycosyltransferase RgtA/B/C/D-like domain-containing protein n=1 Tax=candidate division WS5 bacterium TaxID=2093353 RepID=A0A419DEF3_9BACT|nr:MAG: hypothetical protein C4544_03055 [candidate division WS5 bacterium]
MNKESFLNKAKSKFSFKFRKNIESQSENTEPAALNKKSIMERLKNPKELFMSLKNFFSRFSYLWIILLFAFLTRLYRIGSLGANREEMENIERIFSVGNSGEFLNKDISTNLYYALQNGWGRAFGFSLVNMRLLSVLLGILGLYVFYKFVEEWFNRRLAYISTFLISISSFHIFLSRNISHEVLYPVIIVTSLYVLTLAYRYKMWQYFVLAGALLGLGFYVSETTFVLAILFIISGIYFYTKNRKFFTSFVKEKALAILAALIVSLPFIYFMVLNPGVFLSNFTYRPDIILDNARKLVSSIFLSSPGNYMYTVDTDKIFDPFMGITFLLGLIFISLRIKRRKFYFLFAWLVFFALAICLDSTFSLGNIVYLLPVIFILSGRIQTYVLEKWFKTFPFNKFARVTMILGIGFLFALSLTYNYRKVFLAWDRYPDRKLAYNVEPASLNLDNEKAYLYGAGISKETASVILKIKKENLVEVAKLENIPKEKNLYIITSPNQVSSIKTSQKDVNWEELKGKDLNILKGVKSEQKN